LAGSTLSTIKLGQIFWQKFDSTKDHLNNQTGAKFSDENFQTGAILAKRSPPAEKEKSNTDATGSG
jgi:hypothetical protein